MIIRLRSDGIIPDYIIRGIKAWRSISKFACAYWHSFNTKWEWESQEAVLTSILLRIKKSDIIEHTKDIKWTRFLSFY